MKLVIQIPSYNEAATLPITLDALPRSLPGFDAVEVLVVDDGSDDGTSEVARRHGADHVVRHIDNRGLAASFATGLRQALALGADVIVNTDADNQYCADDIGRLVEPILDGRADVGIGARPIGSISEFSAVKKWLQRIGSATVRRLSGIAVDDAPSGFRAFSREAASQINVFTSYTYTLETIVQAGILGLAVESVPVRVNPSLRESRLIRSIPRYVWSSLLTLLRIFLVYRPLRVLVTLGSALLLAGGAVGLRFLYFYLTGDGDGHVQSLILAATLILMGVQIGVLGVVADLISANRRLLESVRVQLAAADEERPAPDRRSTC